MTKNNKITDRRARVRHLIGVGLVLICAMFFLRLRFQLGIVIGESMLPTLKPGDLLVVDKLAYRKAQPVRGDIVRVRYNEEVLVKRVVGLPGEEIEMKEGILYRDSAPLLESWPITWSRANIERGTMAQDTYALLGDNRAPWLALVVPLVPQEQIIGKVIYRAHIW